MKDDQSKEAQRNPIIRPSDHRRFSLFPKSLANSVERVVKPVYKKHGFAEHRILTEWANVVGAELAACSMPQKLVMRAGDKKEGGTLHILVGAGRALELQHMQPLILDKIATYFGYPAVARLVFMQTSAALFRKNTAKAETATAKSPGKTLQKIVAQCEDDDLRRALLSLGTRLTAVEN